MDNILLELLPGLVLFVIIPMLILIVLIPLAIKEYKKKSKKKKINKLLYKDLEKNYRNDFNNILNEIYNDSTKATLENSRKKYLIQTYIIIAFIFICIFSMLYNVILFSKVALEIIVVKVLIEIIGMMILVFAFQKIKFKYEIFYKNLIVKPALELLYPNLTYTGEKALELEVKYAKLNFDNRYLVNTETNDCLKGVVDEGTLLEMADLKANVNHVKRIK